VLGTLELSRTEADGKNNVSVLLPLSFLAHFAVQNLSFHPSPGLPCELGLSQGEPPQCWCSGESQAARSQQDAPWPQPPAQPVPRRVAQEHLRAFASVLGWMGRWAGDQGSPLSTRQQGGWQGALSDASGAKPPGETTGAGETLKAVSHCSVCCLLATQGTLPGSTAGT